MQEENTTNQTDVTENIPEEKIEFQVESPVTSTETTEKPQEETTTPPPAPGFDDRPPRRFLGFRKPDENVMRDKLILEKIKDDDLLEYLKLEQKRFELLQQAKDIREKRILSAFQLSVSLAASVAVIYFLKDEPTILMSVLYICGLLIGFWIWKKQGHEIKF